MEEKSNCEDCRTWEEEMYWKHFNSMHFYLILPKNFHDHLVLPEKFAAHMTAHLPDKMSLIGPSGAVWVMEIQKSDYLLLVGDGWKDFVKTYELTENSLLVFKYKRNSSFEVLIFDQESFCEKEASYFIKKCRHFKSEHENHKKRIVREGSSTEVIENEKDDDCAFVLSKESKKNVDGEVNCLRREENTQNHQNPTNATSNSRGKRRKMVEACNSLSKSKARSKEKPCRNEATQELIQNLMEDMTTPENEESYPKKDHFDILQDQSEKNPSENAIAQELSPISGRDWSTPENGEDSSEMNYTQKWKSLSGKEQSENGTAKRMSQISSREPIILNGRECSPEADDSHKPRRKRGRPKKNAVPKSLMKQVPGSVSAGKGTEYVSNRRTVTELEKEVALQRAKQEQTENSFIVVMRPSSVYRRFYLSIPAEWMNKHLAPRHQDFVLRVEDKTWHTMFYYYGKRGVGGLCGGWKKFAIENSLEEFDVLLFKLANQEDDSTIVFDVDIFRVIAKILPPPLVSTSV